MYKFEDNHFAMYIKKEILEKEQIERRDKIEQCQHEWDSNLFLSFIPETAFSSYPWMLEEACRSTSKFQSSEADIISWRSKYNCEMYDTYMSNSSNESFVTFSNVKKDNKTSISLSNQEKKRRRVRL